MPIRAFLNLNVGNKKYNTRRNLLSRWAYAPSGHALALPLIQHKSLLIMLLEVFLLWYTQTPQNQRNQILKKLKLHYTLQV